MRHFLCIAAAATGLAACGTGDEAVGVEDRDGDGQLSAEEIEDQMGSAMSRGDFLSPGLWESSMRIENVEVPGMTDDDLRSFSETMGERTFRTCLTQAQVEQPDARFFTGEDTDCTYESFTLQGGRIESDLVCNLDGMRQRMNLAGEYGSERYAIDVRAESLGGDDMAMDMRIEARRVGDCEDGQS